MTPAATAIDEAAVLRRLSTNLVDVLTPGGEYVRALAGSRGPVIARVTQTRPKALSVALEGDGGEHGQALDLVRRMLGVDRDLTPFDRAAAGAMASPDGDAIDLAADRRGGGGRVDRLRRGVAGGGANGAIDAATDGDDSTGGGTQ